MLLPLNQSVGASFFPNIRKTYGGNTHVITALTHSFKPSYLPGVRWCDLRGVLPKIVTDSLSLALPLLAKKLPLFGEPDAVLTGPETRSSSPVRIPRGENRQCAVPRLYPCGEGPGWAGGITSAAVDGLRVAEAIIAELA